MKITATTALCGIITLLAFPVSLRAQGSHYIENQRYVVGVDDFSWGGTYLGLSTSGNGLIITNWISGGTTNPIKLSVASLQIGTESNFNNVAYIGEGGELQIQGGFTIQGTNNGNKLLIDDKGSLFVASDFDAAMGGFYYNSGANLKVGGVVSHLDDVEDGLNFTLTGANAGWAFGTNVLTIGSLTDGNSVTISNQANLSIDHIMVGAAGTTSNGFLITDGGRAFVQSNIVIAGTDNYVQITNAGILAVDFDFDTTSDVVIEKGGILEAHRNLSYGGITNGGGIIMSGANANWSNLSGSTLLVGPDTDENFLVVTNGATVRAGNISIGGPTNANNSVLVTDGGNLILEGPGSITYETNSITIVHGGKLTLGSNFSYGLINENIGGLRWQDGGIIEALAEAPVFTRYFINGVYEELGALFLQNGQILVLNGPVARWSGSAYDLHVGDLSADNHLIVTNGGRAFAHSVSVGDFKYGNDGLEGGNRNSILITGTNSALYSTTYVAIGGTIDSGNWYEGGVSNSITVDNAGLLSVGTTLHNRNTTGTSGLVIKPGGLVVAQDYHQCAGAYLSIYTDGINAGLLKVADTAVFDTGALFGFDAVASLDIGTTYTNRIVESGTLVVGGVTNATTSDLDALEQMNASLVNYDLWTTNGDIYATFTRRSVSDGGGFGPGSMLDQIGKEIDRLAGVGNTAASNQVQILSNMGSDAERKRQLEQLYSYQLPTFMHGQGVFGGIDQVRVRGASFHGAPASGAARPDGVAGPGPHVADQGPQGWIKAYGSYGNHSKDSFDDGYDAQTYGTVIGFDRSFGEWLFGIAGGYAGSNIKGDNGDESDATTGYGVLYTSYGTQDWFGDLVASYGVSDIDNDSGTAFDVTSSTEASHSTLYIGGGKEYTDPDGSAALLRPLAGLQISLFSQDGYTEKSSNAVGKKVDSYDRWSYLSTLGAEMALPKAGATVDWETQFRAYWLHEFNGDEQKVDYTLVGSTQPEQFVLRSPDQNVGQFGVGCVAKWKNGWQVRADLDGQVGKSFYATTLSGALLYEF